MATRAKLIILLVIATFSFLQSSYAQVQNQYEAPYEAPATSRVVKRSIATVLFASLGGAVLGLSTLSFYGEPENHTENITYGALLGLIGGTSYLLYSNANQVDPRSEYGSGEFDKNKRAGLGKSLPAPMVFNIAFSF